MNKLRTCRGPRETNVGLLARSLAVACWFAIASTAVVPAATGQDAPSAAAEGGSPRAVQATEVRQALRDLDSAALAERDAAEKRLVEMGAGILPFLPEISSSTSGEMKIRLQRIRDQLQKSNIETFFDASLITLSGKHALGNAIQEISKQSGNPISLENAESSAQIEVELTADKQPFWQVIDDLLAQSKLRINAFSGAPGLSLGPAFGDSSEAVPAPQVTGPFRISAISVQSTLPFGSSLGGQLGVSLLFSWEPRLKPVFVQLPMRGMQATTDRDDQLQPTNPESAPEIPLNAVGCSTQIDLQFTRPPRAAGQLDKLSGEIVIAVPSERHKYVFEKFASGKRQSEKYGEVTVTLESARRNRSVYELRILTEFQKSEGALDSFRGWILSNRAYLLDAKQNRLENVGLQTYAVTPEAVGVSFLFQINGDPNDYTLVYESPAMITRQKVPFELHNIELP